MTCLCEVLYYEASGKRLSCANCPFVKSCEQDKRRMEIGEDGDGDG